MKDKHNNEAQNLPEQDEEEKWLPAPGFEDRYEVSSFGNVRRKSSQRLRKINYDCNGYPILCLKINNKVHYVYIHRLVCAAFNGPPTKEHNICDHKDRCKVNNYYKNLRWTDHSGNRLNCKPSTHKKNISVNNTPIVFLDLTGKLQQRFDSILQAHDILGLSIMQIQQNLRGVRRPFKNGYFLTETDYQRSLTK